jgi:PST family polysaccharide transporter
LADTQPSRDESLSRSELKAATLKGVRWVTLARLIVEVTALGSSVLVARLVSPTQFGYAAAAAFFLAVSSTLASGSFGSPLVQARVLRPELVRTALTLSLVTGAAGTGLVIALASTLDALLPDEAVELLVLAAPAFFVYSAGAVSQALLQRSLDFRRSALNEIVASLPGTFAMLAAAASGLGGASIVIGFLVQAVISTVQAMLWRPPGRPGWDARAARYILRFGLPTSGASLVYTAQRNAGLAILSAALAPALVGFYWRAAQLGVDYQGKISGILMRILFPVLSRTKDLADLRAVRERMVRVHTSIIFPLLALLVVLAPVLVPWLYGERWAPAAAATQILAVNGFLATIGTGTGPLMMAIGRPSSLLAFNVCSCAAFIVVLLLTAPHGLIPVCVGVAGLTTVLLLVSQYVLVQRLAGIPLVDTLVRDVRPAFTGAVILVAVAWPLRLLLEQAGTPPVVVLAVTGVVGALAYGACLQTLFRGTWTDLVVLGRQVLPARKRLAAARP